MSDTKATAVETINPTTGLILTIVTCSIYELFFWWPARFRALNSLLGRDEFKFGSALIAVILTCGTMYFYFDYKAALAINELRAERGQQPNTSLPMLTVLLDIFGMAFVTSYMHQEELNKLANA